MPPEVEGSEGKAVEGEKATESSNTEAALSAQLKAEKDARRAAQGKLAELEHKFKAFEGIDPEQIRTVIAEKAKLEEERRKNDPAKLEEHYKTEQQKLREKYEAELKAAKDLAEQLKKTNKTLTVTDKVMSSIGKLFNDDVQDVIKGIVERHCDVGEDGKIFITDGEGNEMPSPKNPLIPITIEEFGAWLVEKRPSLAKASGTGGTREPNAGERARRLGTKVPTTYAELQAMGPAGREVWNKMTPEEKAALGSTMKLG